MSEKPASDTPEVDEIAFMYGKNVVIDQEMANEKWNRLLNKARDLERQVSALREEQRSDAKKIADFVVEHVDNLRAEREAKERAERQLAEWDRILRASVEDEFKGAASPVGAAQGYIASLEQQLAEARKE